MSTDDRPKPKITLINPPEEQQLPAELWGLWNGKMFLQAGDYGCIGSVITFTTEVLAGEASKKLSEAYNINTIPVPVK